MVLDCAQEIPASRLSIPGQQMSNLHLASEVLRGRACLRCWSRSSLHNLACLSNIEILWERRAVCSELLPYCNSLELESRG